MYHISPLNRWPWSLPHNIEHQKWIRSSSSCIIKNSLTIYTTARRGAGEEVGAAVDKDWEMTEKLPDPSWVHPVPHPQRAVQHQPAADTASVWVRGRGQRLCQLTLSRRAGTTLYLTVHIAIFLKERIFQSPVLYLKRHAGLDTCHSSYNTEHILWWFMCLLSSLELFESKDHFLWDLISPSPGKAYLND